MNKKIPQFGQLSVDELFAIKGGVDCMNPYICETYACTSHFCDNSACSGSTNKVCASSACKTEIAPPE